MQKNPLIHYDDEFLNSFKIFLKNKNFGVSSDFRIINKSNERISGVLIEDIGTTHLRFIFEIYFNKNEYFIDSFFSYILNNSKINKKIFPILRPRIKDITLYKYINLFKNNNSFFNTFINDKTFYKNFDINDIKLILKELKSDLIYPYFTKILTEKKNQNLNFQFSIHNLLNETKIDTEPLKHLFNVIDFNDSNLLSVNKQLSISINLDKSKLLSFNKDLKDLTFLYLKFNNLSNIKNEEIEDINVKNFSKQINFTITLIDHDKYHLVEFYITNLIKHLIKNIDTKVSLVENFQSFIEQQKIIFEKENLNHKINHLSINKKNHKL